MAQTLNQKSDKFVWNGWQPQTELLYKFVRNGTVKHYQNFDMN